MEKGRAIAVLKTVETHLSTPLGLRSLNPEHPEFKAKYEGNSWSRDTAYHQGTVWAFLHGEYLMAHLKVNGIDDSSREFINKQLEQMMQHFYEEDCIYGISEIFDGLNPGAGRGTIQQAWSIGTLIPVLQKVIL